MANLPPFTDTDSANQHTQWEQLVEELKKDPNGWKTSIDTILNNRAGSPHTHFFLLKVVEDYLEHHYAGDSAGQEVIRFWLSQWISGLNTNENFSYPAFLMKKMAHIFSLVFVVDFPGRWPNFMQEVFLRNLNSQASVHFLLQTLLAIDSEVVDREIRRNKEVFDRNTLIKDSMRELCLNDLALTWATILRNKADTVARSLCLNVIKQFVDWIDLELIYNDTMIPLIIDCLGDSECYESGVGALCAVMEKGMPPVKKLALVSSLYSIIERCDILGRWKSDEDEAYQAAVLVNTIGYTLVDCYSKFDEKTEFASKEECRKLIDAHLNATVSCLSHKDFDVSQAVVDFLRQYVLMLKSEQLSGFHIDFLNQLISAIIVKFAAPEDINLENDGENECRFLEYRTSLRNVLTSVGTFRPELIIANIEPCVRTLCTNWSQLPIPAVEATLSIVFALADVIHFNISSADPNPVDKAARELVMMVLSSSVSCCRKKVVNLQFFEIVCRYDKLLLSDSRPVSALLEAFLDDRGIFNDSPKVRTRAAYLFCRFIKAHRIALSKYVETIIRRLAPLLATSPQSNSLLTECDQMFIYEATSTMIVFGSLTPELKEQYMNELVGSLMEKFEMASKQLVTNPSDMNLTERQATLHYLNNIIAYSSRITKAFSISNSMESCRCTPLFIHLMQLFLSTVSAEDAEMLDSLRQFLHRMVVCLNGEILPILPHVFKKMLSVSTSLKSLHDFLILVQQIFSKFKGRLLEIPIEIRPLFDLVWNVLSMEHDTSDEIVNRNLIYLNRVYLQMIYNALNSDLFPMFVNAGCDFLDRLSASLLALCFSNDPVAKKLALTALGRFIQRCREQQAWVLNSLWDNAMQVVPQVPLSQNHDPSDAQCMIVQHEAFGVMRILRDCFPERFDATVNALFSSKIAQEFCESFALEKSKQVDKRVDQLYEQIRQMRHIV